MTDEISYTRGIIYDRSTIYVTAVIDELEKEDVDHALMLRWSDGKWDHWPIEGRIVSHCACPGPNGRLIFALGEDGQIQVADGSNLRWESLASLRTRSGLGNLTSIRQIGNAVYVVGMQRQVYKRRLSGGEWIHTDLDCVVPAGSSEIASFEAIAGTSKEDIYAAGLYGEIWHFDGIHWIRMDSPTNVKLQAICCVDPCTTYIAGARGLVLRGNGLTWNPLLNTSSELTIWSIAKYGNEIYLSTNQGNLLKIQNDEVSSVKTGLEPFSTFYLDAKDGLLLSTGRKDVAVFDGSEWRRLSYRR